MIHFIKQMRTESRQKKARYALVGASVITAVISIVWITTLDVQFSGEEALVSNDSDQKSFTELFNSVRGQVGNIINTETEDTMIDVPEAPEIESVSETHTEQEWNFFTSTTTNEEDVADKENDMTESVDEEELSASNTSREARVILIGTTSSTGAE